MKLPACLYGFCRDALAAAEKAVTRLKRGATLLEAFQAAHTSDTAAAPGLLVLSGPSPLLGGQPHFHCYLPLLAVMNAVDRGRLDRSLEHRVFLEALESDWGLLAVISPANLMWVYPKDRYWPLLRKLLPRWEELRAEGPRYTVGSASGDDLWALTSNVKYVLANLGVSNAVLNSPLPPDGLSQLLRPLSPD